MRATRKKLPAGIAQIGKSFRNEITPGNFIFRVREFEQMELEFFCKPGEDLEWFSYWRAFCRDWLLEPGPQGGKPAPARPRAGEARLLFQGDHRLRVPLPLRLGRTVGRGRPHRLRPHPPSGALGQEHGVPRPRDQRKATCPTASSRPWAWTACSWPSCATPTTRRTLEGGDVRTVLHLHPALAPYQVRGAAPAKEQARRPGHARSTRSSPNTSWSITTRPAPSASATAARTRSARPCCVTVDFDTVEDGTVTVRDRDTMTQVRVKADDLPAFIGEKLTF